MAKIQELLLGLGKAKQASISSANSAAQIIQVKKSNAVLANPKLVTETDADELGKGHEFPTQVFRVNWDIAFSMEFYLSSIMAAWAAAFGLGKSTVTGTGPFTYTCTPLNPVNDGEELPYFTYVEQMRPGGGVIIDHSLVGGAVEGFSVQIGTGPARSNRKLVIDVIGSGKMIEPSSITLPALTSVVELPQSSIALTVNGVDYVTSKNLVSLEFGWKNNLKADQGFFPGSGTQDGAAIRGRMEIGSRTPLLRFTARYKNGSDELTKLKNGTTGTATVNLSAGANDSLQAVYHKVAFSAVDRGETDGVVTVAVECAPMYDPTNGVCTFTVVCGLNGIAQ